MRVEKNMTRREFYRSYEEDIHSIIKIVKTVVKHQGGVIHDSKNLFKTIFEYIYLYSDKKPIQYECSVR